MSRVTIDDIQHDASGLDNMSWAEITKLYQIEVVPRKMVEMIIKDCLEKERYYKSIGRYDIALGVCIAREYAESLLKQFEED